MTRSRHTWHDAGGRRHAICRTTYPLPPRPGESVMTLCGLDIMLTEHDFPQLAQYRPCRTTCLDCDAEWRIRENIPPRKG